jgi:hypothetical protein
MNFGKIASYALSVMNREDENMLIVRCAILPCIMNFADKGLPFTADGMPQGAVELLAHATAPQFAWFFPNNFSHGKSGPAFERRTRIEYLRIKISNEESARKPVYRFLKRCIHTLIIP